MKKDYETLTGEKILVVSGWTEYDAMSRVGATFKPIYGTHSLFVLTLINFRESAEVELN